MNIDIKYVYIYLSIYNSKNFIVTFIIYLCIDKIRGSLISMYNHRQ